MTTYTMKKKLETSATSVKTLKAVRDHLYGGSWNRMVSDMRKRMSKKPVLANLNQRLEADIKRIQKFKKAEA